MQLGTAFEGCFGVRSEALIRSSYSAGGFSILDFNLTWDDNPYLLPICCLFVASFYCACVPRAPAQTALHAKRELWTGYLQKAACPRTWASGQSLTATTMYKLLETGCWGSYIFKGWGSSMTFCVANFQKSKALGGKTTKTAEFAPQHVSANMPPISSVRTSEGSLHPDSSRRFSEAPSFEVQHRQL